MNNDALYDKPYPLNFVFNFSLLIRDYSRVHEYAGCDDDWGGGSVFNNITHWLTILHYKF